MSVPWQYSQALGGQYVYNPRTDVITMRNGRSFQCPSNVPRANLRAANYQGSFEPQKLTAHPNYTTSQANQLQTGQLQAGQNQALQGQHNLSRQISQGQYQGQIQQQPRNVSSGSNTQQLAQGMAQMNLGAASQVQIRNIQRNGANFQHTADPRTYVQQIVRESPPAPNELQRDGIIVRQQLLGTTGTSESLYPAYSIRNARFFCVGRVFLVLWAEPAGGNKTAVTVQVPGTVRNHLGEAVFSKVRRFVVIRESGNYCSALPITTYSGRGVAKRGVVKSEHAIIYTGQTAPQPTRAERPGRGEAGMRPVPIRVDPDSATDLLDPMSRIDFGGVHQVQHNIKTKSLGMVNRNSINALQYQFRSVWEQLRSRSAGRGLAMAAAGGAGAAGLGAAAVTEDDEEEDEEEDEDEQEDTSDENEDDDGGEEDDDEEEDDEEEDDEEEDDDEEEEDDDEGNDEGEDDEEESEDE